VRGKRKEVADRAAPPVSDRELKERGGCVAAGLREIWAGPASWLRGMTTHVGG
jgi:hypothetical protein